MIVWSVLVCIVCSDGFAADKIDVVKQIDTGRRNKHYVGNRKPLIQSPLTKLLRGAQNRPLGGA